MTTRDSLHPFVYGFSEDETLFDIINVNVSQKSVEKGTWGRRHSNQAIRRMPLNEACSPYQPRIHNLYQIVRHLTGTHLSYIPFRRRQHHHRSRSPLIPSAVQQLVSSVIRPTTSLHSGHYCSSPAARPPPCLCWQRSAYGFGDAG